MKFLTELKGVGCSNGPASLCRDSNGRLVLFGSIIDLFDLLDWIDKNPLTQFREIPKIEQECWYKGKTPAEYQPEISEQFAHLFDENGNVI